jgi:hypothetical protein
MVCFSRRTGAACGSTFQKIRPVFSKDSQLHGDQAVQVGRLEGAFHRFATQGIGFADNGSGRATGAGQQGGPGAGPVVAATAAVQVGSTAHFAGGDHEGGLEQAGLGEVAEQLIEGAIELMAQLAGLSGGGWQAATIGVAIPGAAMENRGGGVHGDKTGAGFDGPGSLQKNIGKIL